jgi:Tfp pilus assembly protein PilF
MRNAALTLLTAVLLAHPALAATQQDWDDCSGQDATRSAPACSRIIAEPSASAQDRADAYLYRGNTFLMQGNVDGAMADYSEAIRLTPRNVVAHASRALVHLRKGDRTAALADYRAAQAIDAASARSPRSP